MKPIIFAGPSLFGTPHGISRSVDIAPPAKCGDLASAAHRGRRTIGLIDGTFESGPAVWHKEILYALSLGCVVVGASSMGALRAAECQTFGMIGVGRIFADYATGRRQSDGDVALIYGPPELGYPPLSVALVDTEDALERMLIAGIIDVPSHARVLRASRTIFFKDRTWESVLRKAGLSESHVDGLLDWLAESGPSLKTRDALELLETIDSLGDRRSMPYRFESTHFFDQLQLPLEGDEHALSHAIDRNTDARFVHATLAGKPGSE
jgi:hypothetical protein